MTSIQSIVPTDYQSWKHCITEICRITITSEYLHERIRAMNDQNDSYTARYIELYCEQQRQLTLAWFARAQQELARE